MTLLERLRSDVNGAGSIQLEPTCFVPSGRFVNVKSPANIRLNGSGTSYLVEVLADLDAGDRAQAEAHELCHLLLRSRGLVECDSYDDGMGRYLALQINNLIYHRHLIRELEARGISSELHIRLVRQSMEDLEALVAEYETELHASDQLLRQDALLALHGIGVKLLDACLTVPGLELAVAHILAGSNNVAAGFAAAQKHLLFETDETSEEQVRRLGDFLSMLGYSSSLLQVR